jgi:hypothetical protein
VATCSSAVVAEGWDQYLQLAVVLHDTEQRARDSVQHDVDPARLDSKVDATDEGNPVAGTDGRGRAPYTHKHIRGDVHLNEGNPVAGTDEAHVYQ